MEDRLHAAKEHASIEYQKHKHATGTNSEILKQVVELDNGMKIIASMDGKTAIITASIAEDNLQVGFL